MLAEQWSTQLERVADPFDQRDRILLGAPAIVGTGRVEPQARPATELAIAQVSLQALPLIHPDIIAGDHHQSTCRAGHAETLQR